MIAKRKVLGIDVGGTNVDVVLYDGKFRFVETRPTSEVFSDFTSYLSELIDRTGARAIGIGAAVWLRGRGKIPDPVFAPNLSGFEQLRNLRALQSAGIDVVLENDANCFAVYAAHVLKAEDVFGITVGTGVGSGIVVGGKIYRGMGMAGELGHVNVCENGRICGCGERGHLEAYFGGRAFEFEGKSAKDLVESGAIYATEGFRHFCMAIANAVRLLDPEVIALGGRIGMNLDTEVVRDCVQSYLPEFYSIRVEAVKDEMSVAKGACLSCINWFR